MTEHVLFFTYTCAVVQLVYLYDWNPVWSHTHTLYKTVKSLFLTWRVELWHHLIVLIDFHCHNWNIALMNSISVSVVWKSTAGVFRPQALPVLLSAFVVQMQIEQSCWSCVDLRESLRCVQTKLVWKHLLRTWSRQSSVKPHTALVIDKHEHFV